METIIAMSLGAMAPFIVGVFILVMAIRYPLPAIAIAIAAYFYYL